MAIFIIRYLRNLFDVNTTGAVPGDVLTLDVDNVTWVPGAGGGGGGAPTTADYLVGTANASLTNEIVVGATPGGELGNTWASPTVDTVHSGSSHAATQAAAEATAAAALLAHTSDPTDAHDGSAISNVPAGSIAATDVQAALNELDGDITANLANAVIINPASSARNVIQPTAGAVIAAIIKAHAAQSVDLTQWQTSAGAVLAKIDLGGSTTFSPSVLAATGAVLIDAGTLPLLGPNDPRRAVLNMKAVAAADTFGDPYGARIGSYRDGNFDHVSLGKYDWWIDIYEPAGASAPYMTLANRRASDRRITGFATFGPSGFQIATQDPLTESTIKTWIVGTNGVSMYDMDNFVIYDTLAGGVQELAFQRIAATWRFGVFTAAPSPVVQQAASSLAALWTGLKNYGWLTAGSTVPAVYEPGGTDVAVADGGTGASTAAGARTNLGLVIGTDVAAQTDVRFASHENGHAGVLAPTTLGWNMSGTAFVANRCLLARFVPTRNLAVTKIAFMCQSAGAAGNKIDVGIYSADLATRLGSSGSIVTSPTMASAGLKVLSLTATVNLVAGTVYYAAMVPDTTAGQYAAAMINNLGTAGSESMFGATIGEFETGIKDVGSGVLPASIATPTPSSYQGPALAVRES